MGYFEEWKNKEVQAAEKRTEKRSADKFARKCLEIGKMTLEDIAMATGLTLKRVQRLAETL